MNMTTIINTGIPILNFLEVIVSDRTSVLYPEPSDGTPAIQGSSLTVTIDKSTLFASGISYHVIRSQLDGSLKALAVPNATYLNMPHLEKRVGGGYTRWSIKDIVNMSLTTSIDGGSSSPATRMVPFAPLTAFTELPFDSVGKQLMYILAKITTLGSPITANTLQQSFGNVDKVISVMNIKISELLKNTVLEQSVLDKLLEHVIADEGVILQQESTSVANVAVSKGKRDMYLLLSKVTLRFRVDYALGGNNVTLSNIPMLFILKDV